MKQASETLESRPLRKTGLALILGLGAVLALTIAPTVQAQRDYSQFHHPKSSLKKYNYDSLYNSGVEFEKSKEAQDLYERCLVRYGGRELLAARTGYRLQYEMTPTSSPNSVSVTKSVSDGRRYKVERMNLHGFETRTLNGDQAWYTGMDTVLVLDKGRYKAETFSYLTLTMPLGLETESFSGIRYGARPDDSLLYFYMKKEDSLMIIIGLHPEDLTIRSSEGVIYDGDNTFSFINFFSDFAEFDGYLFARSLTNVSMGLEVAKSTLKSVEVNPEFADDEFEVSDAISKDKERIVH